MWGMKREPPPDTADRSDSKAPRVAAITVLEIWEAVQRWGEANEISNPSEIQRISTTLGSGRGEQGQKSPAPETLGPKSLYSRSSGRDP